MAEFYASMRDMAIELLSPTDQDGLGQQTIELVRYTAGPPPVEPWLPPTPETRTVTLLKAVAKGVSKGLVGAPIENGGQIVATDLEVIAAPWGGSYDPTDVLLIDGLPVTVLSVQNIPAAGIVCAIRFLARR